MPKNPAQRFQDEMKKLGLGVSIQVGGREPVVITEWRCPECAAKREVGTENPMGVPCPRCDSTTPAVLELSGIHNTGQNQDRKPS